MSLHGVYDSQNIFAKIIRGEAPCYKVYEDEDVLAFLDLFPQSYGHTLVIPKHAEARNLLEIDAQNLAKVMAVVQRLTRALVEEVQPDGVQVAQFNGAPPGRRSSTSISTSSRASVARTSASMRRSRATRKCSHNFRSVWRSVCKADCARAGPDGAVLRSSNLSEIFCYILSRVRRTAVFRRCAQQFAQFLT